MGPGMTAATRRWSEERHVRAAGVKIQCQPLQAVGQNGDLVNLLVAPLELDILLEPRVGDEVRRVHVLAGTRPEDVLVRIIFAHYYHPVADLKKAAPEEPTMTPKKVLASCRDSASNCCPRTVFARGRDGTSPPRTGPSRLGGGRTLEGSCRLASTWSGRHKRRDGPCAAAGAVGTHENEHGFMGEAFARQATVLTRLVARRCCEPVTLSDSVFHMSITAKIRRPPSRPRRRIRHPHVIARETKGDGLL